MLLPALCLLAALAAAGSCDFGALDACPLATNRSAQFPADGPVEVGFDLRVDGGAARLYLLSAPAFAAYSATGAAVPLADTCAPAGFSSCAGRVGVSPGGPLFAVLEAVGPPSSVSGSVTVGPKTDQETGWIAPLVVCLGLAGLVLAVVAAWALRRRAARRRQDASEDLGSPPVSAHAWDTQGG